MFQGFYGNRWLPAFLAGPQVLLIFLFFYLPVYLAFYWSFFLERPFSGGSAFVGMENYRRVIFDPTFWDAAGRTIIFMSTASLLAVIVPLVLAVATDRQIRLSSTARNVLIWPKAIAGASLGCL